MTRKTSTIFGSVGRMVKTVSVAVCLLCSSTVMAEESNYKIRVHKNLMKNVLDKNFPVLLEHIESKIDRNVYLDDVDATIDDISLQIMPQGGWDGIQSDLFFDQGQIVMEINGLEYQGRGSITDPNTGIQETLTLKAQLDLCQMVLSLDQDLTDEGYVYPKISITDVAFTLQPDMFLVRASGDLPLYKNQQFETSIKKWLTGEMKKREEEFKLAMQISEREIMSSFAFQQKVTLDATATSTLSETMQLSEEHALLSYHTDFQGPDLREYKQAMRKPQIKYSEAPEFQKDVQQIIDENYLNYMLYTMFEQDKIFSLSETLFSFWPEQWLGGPAIPLRAIMSAKVWGVLFPGLGDDGILSKIDFRCSLNKDYIKKGLGEAKVSQVFLHEGNQVEMDIHFGCGLYRFKGSGSNLQGAQAMMEAATEFFSMITTEASDPRWEEYRSFYMTLSGTMNFDFTNSYKEPVNPFKGLIDIPIPEAFKEQHKKASQVMKVPYIMGVIEKWDPIIKDLKMFDKNQEVDSHGGQILNDKLNDFKRTMESPEIKMVTDVFNQGIPIVPYPAIERCLGMSTGESVMKFEEGYAIMGFDFNVAKSNTQCLFNMKESVKQKELSQINKLKDMSPGDMVNKLFDKVSQQVTKEIAKNLNVGPKLDVMKIAKDLNMGGDNMFEGVKKLGENVFQNKDFQEVLKNPQQLEATIRKASDEAKQAADKIKNVGEGLFKFFQK